MTSIEQIIQQAVNPFDAISSRYGNFWTDRQDPTLTVNSINQEAIDKIESFLDLVAKDHQTRTLLLLGDSGSGKSYLLGRLKQRLNPKAFFVYIGHCGDSNYIIRHLLRQMVDSLVQVPDGEEESQLLLWLQGLSAFKSRSAMKKLLGERNLFIRNFNSTYPVGMYNPNEFFGVLYDLTNPELSSIAYQWLKGDELDEESLKALRVKKSIDSEYTAQKIIENFGRIADKNRPIVLCFDQLDRVNISAIFSINTNFHNESIKNFLVIISLIPDIAKQNSNRIPLSDKARITDRVILKPINLDRAEELWRIRLHPLHSQATPKPKSPIYPLTRQQLETEYPGGKTNIRDAITLGKTLIQKYKLGDRVAPENPIAEFKLVWTKEFQKQQKTIDKIGQLSSFDLIQVLEEALETIPVQNLETSVLPSKTQSRYSLSYQDTKKQETIGILWSENANMRSFYSLIKDCQKAIEKSICNKLYLIRSTTVGKAKNKGYKLYKQIFVNSPHRHITPHLDSLHYLATYSSLLKASRVGELVVGSKVPDMIELQTLVRQSKVLQKCNILQDLGLVAITRTTTQQKANKTAKSSVSNDVKEYMLDLVKTQQMLGLIQLIDTARQQIDTSSLSDADIHKLVENLTQEHPIQIIGMKSKPESLCVCWTPK
ncbi:ATP-binding protein [Oscillatoriales cyanobacterium LEGE 11467]|uniref:ATP-binding protein n=1 Tax=Zarconia navalis LEGE 11467 TaxID=1828826 RepID=A0A928W213_9CYAN|nr:ATP-binding protein [Zarconia navalis]MBE9041825.1 ATP-binding protein [Zarconia navalis LEGE 11467]